MGCIAVSRLAQSLLAEKYLSGFPDETGINQPGAGTLAADNLTGKNLRHVGALNDIAKARGQSLAQMATAWVLGDARVTTALVGASKPTQIVDWLEPCRT